MDAINTILLLYAIYRLHLNGTAPKPPIRVVAPSNALPEWNKPKKVAPVLPRSDEERNAKLKTEWEINSDFKIKG